MINFNEKRVRHLKENSTGDTMKHLTSSKVEEMYKRYLDGEKILGLMLEFNIKDVAISNFCASFPPKKVEGKKCRHCKSEMAVLRGTKANASDGVNYSWCTSCDHIDFICGVNKCSCDDCLISEKRSKIEKLELNRSLVLSEYHNSERYPLVSFDELDFREKFCLHIISSAVVKCCPDGGEGNVGFVVSSMPDIHTNLRWLVYLLKGGLLLPSSSSELGIYVHTGVFPFDMEKITFLSNVLVPGGENIGGSFFEIHEMTKRYFSEGIEWSAESKDFLLEVMADGVEGHAREVAGIKNPVEFFKSVRLDIEELLKSYCPSQCYYFTNKAYSVSRIRAGYYGGSVKSSFDSEVFIQKHRGLKNRAISEGWKSVSLTKSKSSDSFLSRVFYSLLCGLTEAEVSCMTYVDVLKLDKSQYDTFAADDEVSDGDFDLLGQDIALSKRYLGVLDKFNSVVRFIVMGFDDYEDASKFLGVDANIVKDISERRITKEVVESLGRIYAIVNSSVS